MRYAKYKQTGIPWLPEVPEEWRVVKVKHLCEMHAGKNLSSDDIDPVKGDYCVYGGNGQRGYYSRYNESGEFLLIGRQGALCGNVHHVSGNFWATEHALVTSTRPGIETCYLFRLLHAMNLNQYASQTAAQPGLAASRILDVKTICPPLPEQRAIVAYLDDKCGKIDELVAAKEKEVELLKELKQTVIADAVTHGISHAESAEFAEGVSSPRSLRSLRENDRRLVPSGIPWLPQIPEGWETAKVRQYFRLRATKVSDKDYPALSVAKIGVVPQLEDVAISLATGDSRKLVRKGDYVVNSRSDRKGSCGIAPRDGSVTTISIVLEPHDIDGQFVHYLFRSIPWVEEFYRNGRGIVADLWTTNYQQMRNMLFPYPPLDEQRAIVAYIEEKTAKIDQAVAGLTQQVAALKEYKQRLIADVVTGQMRVA